MREEEFEETQLDFEDTEPGESPTGVLNQDGSRLGGGGGATYANPTGQAPAPIRPGGDVGTDPAENGQHREQHWMEGIGSGDPDGLA